VPEIDSLTWLGRNEGLGVVVLAFNSLLELS